MELLIVGDQLVDAWLVPEALEQFRDGRHFLVAHPDGGHRGRRRFEDPADPEQLRHQVAKPLERAERKPAVVGWVYE